MRKAVLLKQPIGLLKMSHEQAHDERTAMAEVGKEPSPQKSEVGCRDNAGAHLSGKDRDDFHHAQSRNVELCHWVRPQAVHLRSPDFWMVVLNEAAGVNKAIGHYPSSRSARM